MSIYEISKHSLKGWLQGTTYEENLHWLNNVQVYNQYVVAGNGFALHMTTAKHVVRQPKQIQDVCEVIDGILENIESYAVVAQFQTPVRHILRNVSHQRYSDISKIKGFQFDSQHLSWSFAPFYCLVADVKLRARPASRPGMVSAILSAEMWDTTDTYIVHLSGLAFQR